MPEAAYILLSQQYLRVPMLNGESVSAITIGMPVYVSSGTNVKRAQANALATANVFGLVVNSTVAAGGSAIIQTKGLLVGANAALEGGGTFTAGLKYYLSATTIAALTATPPEGSHQFFAPLGTAKNTTDLDVLILPIPAVALGNLTAEVLARMNQAILQ